MRNLLNFLINNSSWFILIFLEIVCFYFIFSSNSYQKSVFLNSSNEVSGKIYSVSGNVMSYFGLREKNEELMLQNVHLQHQLNVLKDYIDSENNGIENISAFVNDSTEYLQDYQFILSKVIDNTVSKSRNFIVINKGSKDGVGEDMGVISNQGIIGVVRSVSRNNAVIQSVLNSNSRFSCKVLNTNVSATLIWDGKDSRYANLIDYPKFENIQKGDTIVTSGFSEVFPAEVLVGEVDSYESQTDENFYSIKVKLSTNFNSLKHAVVINKVNKAEKIELVNRVNNAQKR